MNRRHPLAICALIWVLAAAPAIAEDAAAPKPDKSGYSLFNPVPVDQLRDFSPDRPGKVSGTSTVDAGHFQLETDFFNHIWDPRGPNAISTRATSAPNPVLKIGLTNSIELDIGTSMFNALRQTGPGTFTSLTGYGDTTIAAKINLFGNEGGDYALALFPLIKVPTAGQGLGNGHTEYSLNAPFKVNLPGSSSLTLQPGLGALRNSANTGYVTNYGFIANYSRPVWGDALTGLVEIAVSKTDETGTKPQASFDTALQWTIAKNLALDIGINFGLN